MNAVQTALIEALEGRTAVVIAHRPSISRSADLILVVEEGLIVERGTNEGMFAAAGRYWELRWTPFAVQKNIAVDEDAVGGN